VFLRPLVPRGPAIRRSTTGTTTEEEREVFTATVGLDGGVPPDLRGGSELAHLLDSAEPDVAVLPCRTHDPDLWFADTPAELERAKQLCTGCPVKAECLASALSRAEPWGVWGGEIFERGSVIVRKRPRGRPSKAALAAERAEREATEQSGATQAQTEREAAA
jgi:WhiB family redox-sensing transcriptional regulator